MLKKISMFCLVLPNVLMANYCVQVASVNKVDKVYIINKAKSKVFKNESNIRVEKFGKYFTLRVGDFRSVSDAKASLRRISRVYPGAFIRECKMHSDNVVFSLNGTLDVENEESPKTCKIYLPPNYETNE